MIKVIPFESRYFSLLSYILADHDRGECIIIDPAREISSSIENPLKIKSVINTIKAHKLENKPLYRLTNTLISSVMAGKKPPKTSFSLEDGDEIALGGTIIRILHTPGHSPGSICLYWDGNLISGDTMFTGGIGRTDIPHGSSTSIKKSLAMLLDLPDDTLIWPGHVYGSRYPLTLKENRRAVVWSMNSL